MKKTVFLLVCALILGFFSNAHALIYVVDTTYFTPDGTDEAVDYIGHGWGDVNYLDGEGDFVEWSHNFILDPPARNIMGATLTLSMIDNDGYHGSYEYGCTIDESGRFTDLGEIDTLNYGLYRLSADYLFDGSFNMMLASYAGDFYIDSSTLTFKYDPVPEPGTIVLMGLGLVGLAGYGRKKYSTK